MPAQDTSPKIVQFGAFELDLHRGELRKQGVKVRLQEQPLKVLQVLLDNPGEIISREQLRSHVWPANTFVEFDQSLYSAMAPFARRLGRHFGEPTICRDGSPSRISVDRSRRGADLLSQLAQWRYPR